MVKHIYTSVTHNFYWPLKSAAKWLSDLGKSAEGTHLRFYQEVGGRLQQSTLLKWAKSTSQGLFAPANVPLAMSWEPKVFEPIPGEKFVIKCHDGLPGSNRPSFHPARFLIAKGFRHIESGQTVLAIVAHADNGATKPEGQTDWPEKLDLWKDWAFGIYWLKVVEFAAGQMSRGVWDVIEMSGDFNSSLEDKDADRWYYPARMLASLFRVDEGKLSGLDHSITSHTSDAEVVGSPVKVNGFTDHPIVKTTRAIFEVDDFPRER